MIRDFYSQSSIQDDCRRPANGRPRGGGSGTNNSKKLLPAVPRRGPEAGFPRIHYDFHGLGANPLFMPVSPELVFCFIFFAVGNSHEIRTLS